MTGPRPPHPAPLPERPGPAQQGADPEALLRQALRAQVGGPKGSASKNGDEPRMTSFGRLTAAQILLIAAIVGLALGMGVAFAVVTG